MGSSDSVEPEINFFSAVKKRMYEQYSSELCVFCHKSESVDSIGRESAHDLHRVKEICELRLENGSHEYGSKEIKPCNKRKH